MQISKKILLISIIVIGLLPTLFLPLSGDLSIFICAGKTIAEGGRIYVDFVDLKAPLIYYLFAVIYKIVGFSEIGIRFIDFILQLTTIFFLFRIIFKFNGSESTAYTAGIIYSFTYTSLNFTQLFQIESLAGLPILLLIYLQLNGNNKIWSFIGKGFSLGILAALKIPFALIFIFIIVYDIFNKNINIKERLLGVTITSMSTLIIFGICFMPLLDKQILDGFIITLNYLMFYASMPAVDLNFVREGIRTISFRAGDNFSLFVFLLISVGTAKILKDNIRNDNKYQKLGNFSLLLGLVIFITLVAEKKFGTYNFLRLFVPLSYPASLGFNLFLREVRKLFKNNGIIIKIFLSLLLVLALIFSPVPRWINICRASYLYFMNTNSYNLFFQRDEGSSTIRLDYLEAAKYLLKHSQVNDSIIVISTGANIINFYLPDNPHSKFSQSCYYLSKCYLPKWNSDFTKELQSAEWLVIQNNDRHYHINGHNMSSLESINQNAKYYKYIKYNFNIVFSSNKFLIYKRIDKD